MFNKIKDLYSKFNGDKEVIIDLWLIEISTDNNTILFFLLISSIVIYYNI